MDKSKSVKMTEKELERKLVKEVKRRGGICYKFVSPGHAGVPDRIVLFPGGHIGFIEVKRPHGGKKSPLQEIEQFKLLSLGFDCFTLDEEKDIGKILNTIRHEI